MSETKTARIKNGQCYGTGDNLTSLFLHGKRLSKDSPAHRIYSELSHLKNKITYFLITNKKDKWVEAVKRDEEGCLMIYHLIDPFDYYTLEWLRDNLHSLGSFCFMWGDSERHVFPDNLLDAVEERIEFFQEQTKDCMDFLIQSDSFLVGLDEINNHIRDLEISYVAWHRTLFGECSPTESRAYIASVLNRLSTYVFNLQRYSAIKMQIPETHWKGAVSEYNPPSYKD